MASSNGDGGGQYPLGYELFRGALQCVRTIEVMHEDNLAWLDDYYETYVKSLSSSKDLVPKTPRRTRKRKTVMQDDQQPAALPYPKRATRAQVKDNGKEVQQQQQVPTEAVTPACAVVLHTAPTSSLKLHEQRPIRGPSGAAVPSESARAAAVGVATTSSPAVDDTIVSPAAKCRVAIVRIAGFENMNVKNKALAYEALASGKSDRTGTPGKGSVLTPDGLAKTPRLHGYTPTRHTRANAKPDETSGSAKRTSTGRWLVTEMSDSAAKAKSGCGSSSTASRDKSRAIADFRQAAATASSAHAATPGFSPRPARASGAVATKPPVATSSCGSPVLPTSVTKPGSKPSSLLRQRRSAALRARSSLRKAGSISRRSSARLQLASREPSSSGTERSKKESSGRVAAAAELGARDSVDSGYPESIRGGASKTGKGSAAAEQDLCAVSSSVEQPDETSRACATVSSAANVTTSVPARGCASKSSTSDEKRVTDEPDAASSRQSPTIALSSVATCKAAAHWGSHNGSPPKDDGICVAVAPAATASCATDVLQPNNLRSRTKVILRKDPDINAAAVAAVQPPPQTLEATAVRVTRSKMRVAKPVEAMPVCEPPTRSESSSGTKRQSDDSSHDPSPPAKLMREAIVSLPHIAATTINALPTGSAMKKTATDSCLLSKKYCTPDNVRTVGLTMTNSGQKSFLSASKSTSSLLNRSLTSPGQSRIHALVTTFVKRAAPVLHTSAVEKQKLKEKKLQEKELASTENKKRRDDLLQERLDTIKRQREEKLKRAADLREQQEREKLEKQRLIELKQAEKIEALHRAKEGKIKEEKEKAKMRDLKLQEAEDRRKELELRQQKLKEEEEAARARRARELEEQERAAAAAALKASRAAAAESEQHRAQQEALRRSEKAAERSRAVVAAASAVASAGGGVRTEHVGASSVQPCSVKVLAGTLSEKERLHEERKAQVIAEERRLLAAAAASSKAVAHLTTIEECPKATAAESALKDSTNAAGSASVAAAPAEKSTNPRLTITKVSSSADSYAITPPPRATSRRRPLANPDNYDISDLNSDDETDDETRPRKVVPLWAQGTQLKLALVSQCTNPPDLDALFPESLRQPCDLAAVFRRNKPRYNKRTSSAVWDSPLLKLPPATATAK